jgi:hypothetical protein
MAAFNAGFPSKVSVATTNRFCSSGLQVGFVLFVLSSCNDFTFSSSRLFLTSLLQFRVDTCESVGVSERIDFVLISTYPVRSFCCYLFLLLNLQE